MKKDANSSEARKLGSQEENPGSGASVLPSFCASHPLRTFDAREVEWQPCGHCEGFVGKQGRQVFHDHPPCTRFVEILREFGIELESFKDVSQN